MNNFAQQKQLDIHKCEDKSCDLKLTSLTFMNKTTETDLTLFLMQKNPLEHPT